MFVPPMSWTVPRAALAASFPAGSMSVMGRIQFASSLNVTMPSGVSWGSISTMLVAAATARSMRLGVSPGATPSSCLALVSMDPDTSRTMTRLAGAGGSPVASTSVKMWYALGSPGVGIANVLTVRDAAIGDGLQQVALFLVSSLSFSLSLSLSLSLYARVRTTFASFLVFSCLFAVDQSRSRDFQVFWPGRN